MKLTVENSRRIAWCSFGMALLVVFIHIPKDPSHGIWYFLECGICEIAVPFFFVVSGFFIARHTSEDGWWRRESYKRFRSLLIPYIIWCLLTAGFYCTLTLVANIKSGSPLSRNMTAFTVWHILGVDLSNRPVAGHLWYVRQLLLYLPLLPILTHVLLKARRFVSLTFLAFCFLAQIFVNNYGETHAEVRELFRYTLSMRALFYYSAGIWFSRNILPCSRRWGWPLLCLGLACCFCRMQNVNGTHPFLPPLAASALWEFSTLLLVSGFWLVAPAASLPAILSGTAFPIYLSHNIFISIVNVTLGNRVVGTPIQQSIPYVFFFFILVSGLCIVFFALFRRLTPRLARISFGGRS